MLTVGDRIKELRAKNGLSLSKLSKLSGVPVTTIAHYENGVQPTIDKADKLFRALGETLILGEIAD